jgi:hypothetical protein
VQAAIDGFNMLNTGVELIIEGQTCSTILVNER